MAPRTITPLRLLAALAITVGAWLAAPSVTAQAVPAQVAVEYGATLEAGAKATDTGKSAGRGASGVGDRIGDLVGVTPVRIDTIDTVITASGDDVFIAARVRDVDAPPYTYTCRRGRTTIHSGPNAFAVEHLDELVAFVGAGGHDPTRLEATLREWLGPRTVDLTGYVKDVTITFTPTEPTDTEPLEDCAMFVSRWHVVTPDQSWDDLLDDIAELPCDHTVHIGATDLYRLVRAAVQRVDE